MDKRKLFRLFITFTSIICLLCTGCSGGAAASTDISASGSGSHSSSPGGPGDSPGSGTSASTIGSGNSTGTAAKSTGGQDAQTAATGTRDNQPVVKTPTADGTVTYGNELVTIDASHSDDGYVMVKYNGTNEMVKVLITIPGFDKDYQYTLRSNDYEAFPLTGGSASYKITVYESVSVSENKYAPIYKLETDFTIKDEFSPFLYANQYVNFTKDSAAVAKGASLAASADTDLDVVANVYHYLVDNVIYDKAKAKDVEDKKIKLYLPDPDDTLDTGEGICFDYAALMTTMLRSQRIPTKLVIGYAGTTYHAWISTYITDVGWIDNIIQFDGKTWTMMDPTFAASGKGSKDTEKFITDSSNYTTSYVY